MTIRKPYGKVDKRTTKCTGGMTEQHHKELCNIERIVRDFKRNGVADHTREPSQVFADATKMGSFQERMDLITKTQQEFEMLPADIRAVFNNKTENLIEFLSDEENHDKAVEMGLLDKNEDEPAEKRKSNEQGGKVNRVGASDDNRENKDE